MKRVWTIGFAGFSAAAALAQQQAPAPVPTLVLAPCERPEEWQKGAMDPAVFQEGQASLRWDHGVDDTVSLMRVPADWTGYNTLSFWIHSARATRSRFLLYVGSENPATEGLDYYSAMLTLNFTGWRHYALSLSNLGPSRSPLGWDRIDRLALHASGWNNTPHPDAIVHIDDVKLTKEPPVTGPRLSDETFFSGLDPAGEGLGAVRRAVERADWADARRAYAAYLRARDNVRWQFDWRDRPEPNERPADYDTREADRIVAHELTSCGIPHRFGADIDWSINPTELQYAEWTWQLSRHPFWVTLARAYWATGDEIYAKDFVYQMTDWVADNPVPVGSSGNTVGSRWRTIEAGIRMAGSWPNSFFYFLSSPSFTDDAVVVMVKSMVEHARHLMEHPTSGNWLAMEMNGLYHVGALFPEFRDASVWRSTAVATIEKELVTQVYPDGAQIELAPGYHGVSLNNFLGILELARLNDLPVPDDYRRDLERMFDCYVKIAMPNLRTPALNDSGWGSIGGWMRRGFEMFPERHDFQYLAANRQEGSAPDSTSYWMPYAGWYVMRSDWSDDALYMHFDAGPFGYGHQHEDKLSIIVHAFGRLLLTEGGTYAYDSSPCRRYVLSTRAHNTVMVDGLEQSRRGRDRWSYVSKEPLPSRWLSSATFDFAEGWYDETYGEEKLKPAQHYRCVLFVKPEYWIVVDRFYPADAAAHRYDAVFHFDGGEARVEAATLAAVGADPGVPNLAIVPLDREGLTVEIVKGQEEPTVQGWVPDARYSCRPVATPIFTRVGRGRIVVPWLLAPMPAGDAGPGVVETACEPAGSGRAYRVRFEDGREDVLLVGDGRMEFEGVELDAEFALVRRRKGGAWKEWAVIPAGGPFRPDGQP